MFRIVFDLLDGIVKDLFIEIQHVVGSVDVIAIVFLGLLLIAVFDLFHSFQFLVKIRIQIGAQPFDSPFAEDVVSLMYKYVLTAADKINIALVAFFINSYNAKTRKKDRAADHDDRILSAAETEYITFKIGIQLII